MISQILVVLTIFSISVRYTPAGIEVFDEKEIISVRFHGEDVPEPVFTENGRLVLFYPATYRVEVYEPGNKPVLRKDLLKGHFELESYSAFDADEEKVAVAYWKSGKTYLEIIYFDGRSEKKTFKNLYPADLWIRGGKVILRLYEVKDGHVTRDFLMVDERKVERSGIVAVDFLNGKMIFATKSEILAGHERIPAPSPILDMRVKDGMIFLLLGDGTVGFLKGKKLEKIGKISRPYPRFLRVKGKLLVLTEKGESHEF